MIALVPPAFIVIASFGDNNPPSFVIETISGIPVTVAFIKVSESSVAVPLISSDVTKVPEILSWFNINSVTVFAPIWNLNTFSIIAVALDVWPVIVLPIKSAVSPTVPIALKTFLVSNYPSDTLNICSLG